jgi:acetyl-CoA carboxylase carboxyltransferase component
MCGASSVIRLFKAAWPTAEFAGASIDGLAEFSAREGLEGVKDPEEREATHQDHLAAFVADAWGVAPTAGSMMSSTRRIPWAG